METRILEDADAVVEEAARGIAEELAGAVATRGLATVALSGGRAAGPLAETLARQPLPWSRVHVFQVDERQVAWTHPARNARALGVLLERTALPPAQAHWMPVEARDRAQACRTYQATLRAVAGSPPVLDLVHLGLGEDGHTASLFPGDPAADWRDRDVADTAPHGGFSRMTLTAPVLEAARRLLWVAWGAGKRTAVARLLRADPSVPAGRLPQDRARLVTDRSAAAR